MLLRQAAPPDLELLKEWEFLCNPLLATIVKAIISAKCVVAIIAVSSWLLRGVPPSADAIHINSQIEQGVQVRVREVVFHRLWRQQDARKHPPVRAEPSTVTARGLCPTCCRHRQAILFGVPPKHSSASSLPGAGARGGGGGRLVPAHLSTSSTAGDARRCMAAHALSLAAGAAAAAAAAS